MRKSFLLGGVALLIAAVSLAGQRTRGSERALRGDADEPAAVQFTEIEPGVALLTTVNGFTETVRADGSVKYDEVMAAFGSTERAALEVQMTLVPNRRGGDGELMFANGAVPYFADTVGDNGPAIFSVEQHMQEVRWAEIGEGPTQQMLFADGVVTLETSPAKQTVSRTGIPGAPDGDGTMYVDGVVVTE